MLGRIVEKLRKSHERRGAFGTVSYALGRVAEPLLEMTPRRRRQRRIKEEKDRAFDTLHDVDTSGIIQLNRLGIAGSTWEYGVPYWTIDPDIFSRLIAELSIQHRDFTFVDFGSGKGRALLMATEFPFKKIIGVEFSPELDRIARRNVQTFRSKRRRCRDIELVCTDALTSPLPEGPAVLFFYNPFDREIMERMSGRIEESYRTEPRELYVLYATPKHDAVWERLGCLENLVATGDYTIYRTRRCQG